MRTVFIIFFLLLNTSGIAQKRIEKRINNVGVSTIYINGNTCFKIRVKAKASQNMNIKTSISGEHNEDMVVVSETKHDTLFIKARYRPLFEADNDKLSAHKVMSIEMDLTIPENLNLYISSDIAQVYTVGSFKNVIIELRDGSCVLKPFLGNAKVNTVNGSIEVTTNYAKVKAETKRGQLNIEPLTTGQNDLILKSIHGDISVFKTE